MRVAAWALPLLLLAPLAAASAEEYDATAWAALPDDDARAAVEKLRAAAVDNDAKALVALAGKSGVKWLGAKLTRKQLAARLDQQGVPAFIGLAPDVKWRTGYSDERPNELLVGLDGEGADRLVRLERKKGRWQVAEVRSGELPTVDEGPVALVLVLDRSVSMHGEQLEWAKDAARALVDELDATDMVAVIAFDNVATPLVTLQKASNRLRIATDISRLEAGGGTDLQAALAAAENEIATVTTRKHVILLTDGGSTSDGVAGRVDALRAGGATVSAIGIGDADRNLLQLIADRGEGRLFLLERASDITAAVVKETRLVLGRRKE